MKGDEDIMNELQEAEEQENEQYGKYLTFPLGNEFFGIEIKYVTEIVGIQPITSIPEVPCFVKGIINLRGKIIPVIDVRLKFRKDPVEYDDRTCIIVIDIQNLSVGLIVDNVAEVLSIPDEDIVPPPAISRGLQNRYIKGIGKAGNNIKLLLDCEKLLTEDEIDDLSKKL